MAILNKRRSTSQLPQLQQRSIYEPFVNLEAGERGREILRPSGVGDRGNLSTGRPVTSVVQGARPSLGGVGRQPSLGGVTSTTSSELTPRTSLGGPRASVTSPAAMAPKPSLTTKTTATKPVITAKTAAKPAIAAKPALTSKTTAKPTIAKKPAVTPTKTAVTPTVKPTVKKSTGTTSKLGTALTGAALGATTKAVIDKITGLPKKPVVKPPVIPGTPKPTIGKPPVIPGTPKPPIGKPPITSVVNKPNIGTPPFVPPKTTVKPPITGGGTGVKPGGGSPTLKPPAGGGKPPIVPKGSTAGATGALTEDQIQAELDRVRTETENNFVPEGAVTNNDGSYSVTENGMVNTYDKDGNIIGMEAVTDTSTDTVTGVDTIFGEDTVTGVDTSLDTSLDTGVDTLTDTDTSGMTVLGEGYFEDASGNIYGADGNLMYTVGDDGEYIDASTIDESAYDETTYIDPETGETYNLGEDGNWTLEGDDSFTEEETTYTDPETGFTWNLGDDGEWSQEGFDDTSFDDTSFDDTSFDETDYSFDDTDYSFDDYEGKRGGLVAALMKRGGKVRHFERGGYSDTEEEVQDFQNVGYNYGEFDDPTMFGYTLTENRNPVGNTYISEGRGTGLDFSPEGFEGLDNNRNQPYMPNGAIDLEDGTFYLNNQVFDMESGNPLYTVDDDGNIVSVGEEVQDFQNVNESGTVGDANYSTDELGNTVYTDNDGNQTFYDPQGNVIQTGDGSITSIGSTGGERYRKDPPPPPTGGLPNNSGLFDTIKNSLGTYAGSAAAGALLASLLESADNEGGGGNQSGIDMSQVGMLNPRTTDFGIGPARYVGYDEYGAQDEMPEMYGNELYKNLNAPGFNPVNKGDYADPEEVQYGNEEEMTEAPEEEMTEMADGGAAYQTHYTFGKSVDPLVNLGLKSGQPMKSGGLSHGGLPAFSNVPITQGRLNFRQGAAVHGPGDGQSDDIPAMLADGEYVIDADTVAQIGNGSTKAGAAALDKFRENIRSHKRSAPINKIPPKTKALTSYLKGAR